MFRKSISLLVIPCILLSSCSILEYSDCDDRNNYDSFDQYDHHHSPTDCHCKRTSKIELAAGAVIGIGVLIMALSSDSDQPREVAGENVKIVNKRGSSFNSERQTVPPNHILIEKIALKPENESTAYRYRNLLAEKIIEGRINIYQTYDEKGEACYLLQKGVDAAFVQVPAKDKKFRKTLNWFMNDNEEIMKEIYLQEINYLYLRDIVNQYNSYYRD